MARKTKQFVKPAPPMAMFHVGEINFIKKKADEFMVILSEVGDIDCTQDEWVEEAEALVDEYVLAIGRELGLPHYEEIMRIMFLFIDAYNVGRRVGIGINRKTFDEWRESIKSKETFHFEEEKAPGWISQFFGVFSKMNNNERVSQQLRLEKMRSNNAKLTQAGQQGRVFS